MGRIEVITRTERRRKYSPAERDAIMREADAPDVTVAVAAAGRSSRRTCHGQSQAPCRRHARARSGAGDRQDGDGATMGVFA